MHHAFNFLSDVNDDFRKKIKTLEEDNKSLKVDNINFNKRILNIENVFFTQQQQQLQTSITIHGVPKQKNTDRKNTIIDIAKILKVELTSNDISSFREINSTSTCTNSSY